jgi:two-component system sensor histidine kinase/response regulator
VKAENGALGHSATILLVDDEEGIQRGCRRALEPQGFRVDCVGTLSEARAIVERTDYDVILLDVMLPDGQGIDLLQSLRDEAKDTIVIVITGYATIELAVEAIKQGAYDFIAKPFPPDVLMVAVNRGLEKRRLSEQEHRLRLLETEASELAAAKAEMERLNEFKTSFTLMVAHELRAPISAILSFLRTMRKGYVSPDKEEEVLDRSIDRAEELLDLVNDLLALAGARDYESPSNRQEVSLADVLDQISPILQNQADAKRLSFHVDIQARPVLHADPEQMVQLWTNLISNAIKYTPEGGKVEVRLDEKDGWAIGSVADSGIGIEKELQEKIFEDFYRAPRAKQFNRLGTGLGLTLVKQIVDRYHGGITVQSKPGEGSCFTFNLPVRDAESSGEAEESKTP